MELRVILGICLLLVTGQFQSAVSQNDVDSNGASAITLSPLDTGPSSVVITDEEDARIYEGPTSESDTSHTLTHDTSSETPNHEWLGGSANESFTTFEDAEIIQDPVLIQTEGGGGDDGGGGGETRLGNLVEAEEATQFSLGNASREGHFTNNSRVLLPTTLNLRGYTSISFRTCSHGTLLSQVGSEGDSLILGINNEGSMVLTLTQNSQPHSVTLGRSFNDNIWHRVYLRFELGVLRLGVDQGTVVVANTTDTSASYIDLGLWSSSPQLTIGGNFTGCILQGAGTEFTDPSALHVGVEWGACPLPDGTDCSGGGYNSDHCFSQPCGRHGQCISTVDNYTCNCYTRYSGQHCEEDLGPLCLRPEYQCLNDGLCQEDHRGNATFCACRPGFTGSFCQVTIDENFCDNLDNPCQNNATCTVTLYADTYECHCTAGFSGIHCEVNDDNCATQPCLNGGVCVDGVNDFTCNCEGTGYEGDTCGQNIDECTFNPCANGATCYDLYGSYECACEPGYGGLHCDMEVLECSSDPCQNGGTCSDLQNGYRCSCALGFEGDNCESNINDCYDAICPENSYCEDGINQYECLCNPGFSGIPPTCIEIDECESSPCQNGAFCYDQDNSYQCVCAEGFTGTDCETNIDDCALAPCNNGGTCIDGINTFSCECPAGFEGPNCEDNRNECVMGVCIHAQDCQDTDYDVFGDYECVCEDGWSGKNCDEDIDECASSPCINGATCVDKLSGFDCSCVPGYAGVTCETNINECELNPCLNGGTCHDGINNYTCECGDAYMGINCGEDYDACASSPCQNSATCITTRGQQDFSCLCMPGFEGFFCGENIDDCLGVTCTEGKVCFDGINSYECRCPAGFTGDNCTENIDECEAEPCLNGGTCIDALANFTCICPSGYTGHACETDVDECEVDNPCINGLCQNNNGSYQCYCLPGFSGDHCNLEFDECLSRPCQNGGTCLNRINGYECVCQPGFTGGDCDIDIDECASSPCQNNATCYDGIANFTCECLPGFADILCSTNIDECESNPCLNDGECTDGINSYTCNCTDTGFKGEQCEINIDDCESSPCQHGSTCSDLIKDYNCLCYDGYEGKNCEVDIAECDIVPCFNDATCLELSNLTLYEMEIFTNFSYEAAGGFICECLPGFTGDLCEINIDECESSPCLNGVCIDGVNAYSCQCHPGYEGFNCETEIDECALHIPCIYGSCVDKVADYECNCNDGYGGKNCSVELLGCYGIDCLNGGSCEALLFNETQHDFVCHCVHGFTGRNCQESTTLSLSGNSYVIINSNREEGYELSFRFRTSLPNGILAVGQGETYIKLELLLGRLNLHSSLLNKYEGIFAGSELNDGQWQNVKISVNESHALLAANDEETIHPVNPVQAINSSDTSLMTTSFSTTVLGGATPTLKVLSTAAPFFTGCMEDVNVDGVIMIPSRVPDPFKVMVEEGCPRVEQCDPNPCMNEGKCVDLWTTHHCNCMRPYLGDQCQMSFTPATFGNEDIRDSLVTVMIPEVDHATYRTHADVSMLVRTREPNGLIFYLGTLAESLQPGSPETHLLAELQESQLVIRTLLDGPEELFTIRGLSLVDGDPHLLHVKRVNSELEVYVDNSLVLNTSLSYSGDLLANVLYLGGVPDSTSTRVKRQLGVSNFTTTITRPHFKGTLQDIRLSNGTETRLVQPFPLENVPVDELPGRELNVSADGIYNVLEGTVSDDACSPDPCKNGATCTVTWNDFRCACTFGFKGKTCEDREYCALYQCPVGSECLSLEDGYECIANLTMNGVNSSVSYLPSFSITPNQLTDVSIDYRSQVGGVVFWASGLDATVWIGLTQTSVVVYQANGSATSTTYFTSNATLNGDWHSLLVAFDLTGLQVLLDNVSLLGTDIGVIVDFASLILNAGEIMVGASPSTLPTFSLVDPSLVSSTSVPGNSLFQDDTHIPQVFRGCLGATRIQRVLLPFFSQLDLINNTAANQFLRQRESSTETGCKVCYNEECLNSGFCSDPAEIYSCSCLIGFEGNLCQYNIDECIHHQCLNGASCVDGINEYTCACMPGYMGQFCEEDIDECAASPCRNGAECINEIARFVCQCPEDFMGLTCDELKVKNCSNMMCQNGATCTDIFNQATGIADSYTCTCPFGYSGNNCDDIIDFCDLKKIECVHGVCGVTFQQEGWECSCDSGWEGTYCSEETNECALDPCLNGGTCQDLHNDYNCICLDTWTGKNCQEDVDECQIMTCDNGGMCQNLQGSFQCLCDDAFCGQTCRLDNPCLEYNCSNDGVCISLCDEDFPDLYNQTRAYCECHSGWGGDHCEDEVSILPYETQLAIIVGCVVAMILFIFIVGLVVFLMMAKKKRQTRGTYSPSRQEFYSPRVEMGNMMKPPPEERLI